MVGADGRRTPGSPKEDEDRDGGRLTDGGGDIRRSRGRKN